MKIIGITGISGSGKTTVTGILAELGGFAVETDPLVHKLMGKGRPAYDEIMAAFGTDILGDDGEIYRPVLGRLVFGDKEKLSRLEDILHPKVAAETFSLIAEAEKTGDYKFAIIDAPLLIEANMHRNCDSCWLVTANHATRLARIIARDAITRSAAAKRLASRAGDEALKPHADVIIENNGEDLTALKEKVVKALEATLRIE